MVIYLIAVTAILVGSLTQVDYKDLSWGNNAGMYLTIIAMLIAIFGTVYIMVAEKDEAGNNN